MGEPFDISSLSPEDKALFDAMVAEEMMKLERELKDEVGYPSHGKDDENEYRNYGRQNQPEEFSAPRQSRYDDGHSREEAGDQYIRGHGMGVRVQKAPAAKSPNSLNPQRLTYRGEDKNEMDVGLSCVGVNFGGRQEPADSKRSRQQDYAKQLRQDQLHQPTHPERSKSAIARRHSTAADEEEENYVLSASRSAGGRRKGDAELPSDRRNRLNKQQEYARQLEQDRLVRDNSQQEGMSRHKHSRPDHQETVTSPYSQRSQAGPPSSSRPPYGADGNDKLASTREVKSLKQQEYARQLEQDRLVRDNSQQEILSPYKPTGVHRNSSGSSSPFIYQQQAAVGSDRSGHLSTRDVKYEKQREYARQLQSDQMANKISQEDVGSIDRHLVKRRPVTPPEEICHGSDTFWGKDSDRAAERVAKRREQEAYARQIRNAAEQDAILSPRVSLAAARRRRGSEEDSATGLKLGSDVSTAVYNERKRQQQERYRQELAASASAAPIEAPRAPLSSHRAGYGRDFEAGKQADITTAGLIGHHESDAQQRARKRETQRKYSEDLAREETERLRQQATLEDGARGGSRDHMVSPVTYSSQPSYDDSNYSNQYSSKDLQRSDTELELEYLRMLKEKASRQVNFDSDVPHSNYTQSRGRADVHGHPRVRSDYNEYDPSDPQYDYSGLSAAQAAAVAMGSPYRNQPKYSMVNEEYGSRHEEPHVRAQDAPHRSVYNVLDSPRGAAANPLVYEKPPSSQCTGLVIGGMTVLTAAERAEKLRQQQQYAIDLAEAASAKPVEQPRESWAERNRYKGNGLPGEYAGQRGASVGGGISSVVLGGESPRYSQQSGMHVSPGRMHRRGKQEEYAAQLRLQVEESQQRKDRESRY